MKTSFRSIIALTILLVVLAACSTSAGSPGSDSPSPSEPANPSVEPSVEPSAPEGPADEERDVAGTITVAEAAFSGPGGTIQEALDAGPQGDLPTLVNGVLFRDTDGRIYLATAVIDTDAPTFDGPMLEVLNMDADGPSFDMANADDLGLQEANGIVFNPNAQVLGYLEIA